MEKSSINWGLSIAMLDHHLLFQNMDWKIFQEFLDWKCAV